MERLPFAAIRADLGRSKTYSVIGCLLFRARRKRPGYPAGKGRSRGQNHAIGRPGVPKNVAGSRRFGATRKQLKGIRQCVQSGQRRACFHFACEPYRSLLGKHREGLAGRHTSSIATTAGTLGNLWISNQITLLPYSIISDPQTGNGCFTLVPA